MRNLRLSLVVLCLLSTLVVAVSVSDSAYAQPTLLEFADGSADAPDTLALQSTPQSTLRPTATRLVPTARPTLTPRVRPTLGPTNTPAPNFAPTKLTIYQANPDRGEQTGTCKNQVITFCPPQVALTPRGSTIQYRGQELKSYTLVRSRLNPNLYVSARQRNGARDGTISIEMQFTTPTTWTAKQVIVYDNDPKCNQITYFSGTFLR